MEYAKNAEKNVLINLVDANPGESLKIVKILGGFGLRNKLEALGIREGIEIIKVNETLKRCPVIIQVCNSKIALGFGMAKKILVEKKE